MKQIPILLLLITVWGFSIASQASDSQEHQQHDSNPVDKDGQDKKHAGSEKYDSERSTQINTSMARQVGIKTALVGSQQLQQTVTSYGRLSTGPEQTSHVRARFPGVVQSVKVTTGDLVKAGDLIAIIESNESLKRYELRAPIAGTIVQRHANPGEMTQDQVLFSISNFDVLWAELRIFPSEQQSITAGKAVSILAGKQNFTTTIAHLLPADGDAPYLVARAKLSGEDNSLFPGLMVEGRILVAEFVAPLSVANKALQSIDKKTGVFIKKGDRYIFTPLVLGRADSKFTEVRLGIDPGVEYVVENSYLIKADIEKSEAEHKH